MLTLVNFDQGYPKNYLLGRTNANQVDLNRNFPDFNKIACKIRNSNHLAYSRQYAAEAVDDMERQTGAKVILKCFQVSWLAK